MIDPISLDEPADRVHSVVVRGRPPQFDRDEALAGAVDVFRTNGFDGTSMQSLSAAMGMGPQSIYNTFGNKEQVFLAALDHYCAAQAGSLDRLETPEATLDDLEAFFTGMVAAIDAPICLVLSTATDERCSAREGVALRTRAHLKRVERAFEGVLARAVARGELDCSDTRLLARYLTMCMLGIGVLAEGNSSKRQLAKLIKYAIAPLG